MYEYITGSLVEITPTDAIVEACGVGYDLFISLSTFSKLQGAQGKPVKLFTYHLVREDDEALFGFADDGHTIHLQLLPVATYEINDRWDIDVFSDVLSLNYSWTKTDSDKHTNGKFDFLANNGQLFGVAFTFKF